MSEHEAQTDVAFDGLLEQFRKPFDGVLSEPIPQTIEDVLKALDRDGITLTTRQIECLRWAAEGKSDWEISKILGVSSKTVNYHVEQAKQRLELPTRIQAVVHLVREGTL